MFRVILLNLRMKDVGHRSAISKRRPSERERRVVLNPIVVLHQLIIREPGVAESTFGPE